jgi:hypothetical protein
MEVLTKKKCIKCNKLKNLSDFSFRNDSKKYRNECKDCQNTFLKNYRKQNRSVLIQKQRETRAKYPWKTTFACVKDRCNNSNYKKYYRYGGRGIKCLITEEEVKELWFRDKAYEMKQPSIDRIDNDGNYCFENCRFIELGLNSGKDKEKAILQLDLEGNFIREWKSITMAKNYLKTNSSGIHKCLNGNILTSCGFKWKYKNEKT